MAEKKKSDKPSKREINSGNFKPGESGNEKGRPKRGHALSDQLRSMMMSKEIEITVTTTGIKDGKVTVQNWSLKSTHDFNAVISMALIQRAAEGDVRAFEVICDRLEGRAVQTSIGMDAGSEFKSLPLDAKKKMLAELVEKTLE